MKKITFCIFLLLFSIKMQAQTPPPTSQQIAQQEQQFWSQALVNISSQINTGILYTKITPFSNLYNFNTLEHNTTNSSSFVQAISELHNASDKSLFISSEQLKALKKQLYSAKNNTATPLVDIGIINTSFDFLYYDEENESNGGLRLINGVFTPIANKPSVFTKHVTLISPQQEIIKNTANGIVNFQLQNSLFFNRSKPIKTLVANFGTNTNYTLINNSIFTNTVANVNYTTFGKKQFTFTITYQDNSTQTTYATASIVQPPLTNLQKSNNCVKTDVVTFNSTIPFKAWDENTTKYGQLEYKIFFGDNNQTGSCDISRVKKPFIVVDGFDPGDTRRIEDTDCDAICQKLISDANDGIYNEEDHESIYELMKFSNDPNDNMVAKLQEENYDVIIINLPTIRAAHNFKEIIHDYGADYIERNAMSLVSFIQDVNTKLTQNNSSEKLVVVGPSMGGQITRFALAYMEKKEQETNNTIWDHNTRLWVSVDSPHQGANIPLSIQGSTHFLGFTNESEDAKKVYEQTLRSPAAKQMLIEHYDYIFTGNPSPYFTNYQTALRANGIANSNGYPTKSRNIAMTNGSLTGKTEASAGQRFLDMRGYFRIKWWFIVQHEWTINLFTTKNNYQSHSNQNGLVYDTRAYKVGWNFYNSSSVTKTNTNWQGSLDVVPGGLFNSGNDYKEDAIAVLKEESIKRRMYIPSTEESLVIPHSFISTHSSLDTNGFSDWYKPIDKDIVCSGQTPFDTYYGEKNNTAHVSFTQNAKNWLFQELNGNKQSPTVPHIFNLSSLTGDLAVCDNKTNIYNLDIPNTCSGYTVTWTTSSNIQIQQSTNNSITVTPINGTNDAIGYVNAYIQELNLNIYKKVWVGIPSPNFLKIDILGNYELFKNQWTKIKVVHRMPDFDSMYSDPTIDLTYQWLVPNSYIQTFSNTSIIDVKPFNTGQLNIGVKMQNQCGCTDYQYQLFNVKAASSSNTSGVILTPIRKI